ncbi:SDR family NAD(P)-dependent oxidoreductase [Streptomyces natalensis]|uniref:SDR family NAD(P)-dependent oxidoreductase n=1 Tax=Streptomyces natalensis TaxID=68242 RepID=UPI001F5260E2|nr:SDR family NAD(P)-dependent oxidoreductase [Streptomyces natalensis]
MGTEVADRYAPAEAARRVEREWGPVSVVMDYAGIAIGGPFARTPTELWQRVVDVNLTGSANTARAGLRRNQPAESIPLTKFPPGTPPASAATRPRSMHCPGFAGANPCAPFPTVVRRATRQEPARLDYDGATANVAVMVTRRHPVATSRAALRSSRSRRPSGSHGVGSDEADASGDEDHRLSFLNRVDLVLMPGGVPWRRR